MADANPSFAVIIPVFNEEKAIGATLDELVAHGLTARAEVIVVDDGSTDNTAAIVGKYPVTLVRHPVNKGYGAALKTGVRHAQADKIITMDSDGQHRVEDLPALFEAVKHFPLAIGERSAASHQVANRTLGKRIIRWVGEYLVEQKLPDFNSGLRGFDRRVMKSLLHLMPNGFSFSTTSTLAFLKQGYPIATVPITARPRVGRPSSVRFFRDGIKTMMLLTRIIMLFNPLKIFLPASAGIGAWGLSLAITNICTGPRVSNGAQIIMVLAMFLFFFGLLADQISVLNLREQSDERG